MIRSQINAYISSLIDKNILSTGDLDFYKNNYAINIYNRSETVYTDILLWQFKNNILNYESSITICSSFGYLPALKFLYSKNLVIFTKCHDIVFENAVCNGWIDIVEWMYENGYEASEGAMSIAIYYGYLDIIKLLYKNCVFFTEKLINIIYDSPFDDIQNWYSQLKIEFHTSLSCLDSS